MCYMNIALINTTRRIHTMVTMALYKFTYLLTYTLMGQSLYTVIQAALTHPPTDSLKLTITSRDSEAEVSTG